VGDFVGKGMTAVKSSRKSVAPGVRHVPAEIEGRVRREDGHQNGKNDEIRIVYSDNDHRDRPNFDHRPVGDASASLLQAYHNRIPGAMRSTEDDGDHMQRVTYSPLIMLRMMVSIDLSSESQTR
jgi:hypothetical protein